ncbi:MAG: UDP-N-acetylmuramoyl-tripeptide--D-alanyl-D-alanine ligase [Candidatus Omnitrophica bacterium]|nr:UDP-N-acetylmuramoyl-tripeptide--D-alanyl-D-alanine ligase [Candidatus Omnitrophota bacterium]
MLKLPELLKATKGISKNEGDSVNFKGVSIDSRTVKSGEIFLAIKGENFDGHNFISDAVKKGAKAIIFDSDKCAVKKLPRTVSLIKVENTTKALGDIARSHREKFSIPVIVVTGSNGKTTTKEMIASILSLKAKVLKNEGTKNNHIGLPLTLLKLNKSFGFVVLEAGSNHPGEIAYLAGISLPNIGIITNIGPSHLKFFVDVAGVFKEKYSLTKYLKEPYIAILNADDRFLRRKVEIGRKKPVVFGFGLNSKTDFFAGDAKVQEGKTEFTLNKKYRFTLKTIGYYNIYNALSAIAVGRIFGLDYKAMRNRLSNFNFPKSRLRVLKRHNTTFIDDTYNSNPLSLTSALDALDNFKTPGRKIFVMGDMLELGRMSRSFHQKAGMRVAKSCDCLITVGKFSRHTADRAKTCGLSPKNIFSCENSQQARQILFDILSPIQLDVVLIKGSRLLKMEEVLNVI